MAIIGISGSPIPDGNTDRIIKALLQQSQKPNQFFNLSALRFDPCRACAHRCAKTNICAVEDGLTPCLDSILDSEALVLGTPVHHGTMTAWMFSFLSRLWSFHHVKDLLRGKPILLVVTALVEEGGKRAAQKFADQLQYTHSRSLNMLGEIIYVSEVPPCYKCGMGKVCKVGGLWYLIGQDEEKLQQLRITKDLFKRWEDCPKTVAEVKEYAGKLSTL